CRRAYSETKMTVTCKEKHFSILVAAYLLKSQLEKSYFSNPFISIYIYQNRIFLYTFEVTRGQGLEDSREERMLKALIKSLKKTLESLNPLRLGGFAEAKNPFCN
ncbi:MAG: hypothetical protein AB1390_07220, partial [Nitrospirota bacterium]